MPGLNVEMYVPTAYSCSTVVYYYTYCYTAAYIKKSLQVNYRAQCTEDAL